MENEEFKRKYQKKSKKTNKFLGRESVVFFDTQGIPSKINLKMKKVNQMFMYL